MKQIHRKILRYIKWTFNYFYNHILYWKFHYRNRNQSLIKEKPIVYISLRTNVIRDSITNLVFWFINAGYRVYLHDTFLFIGSMSKLDRLIFKLEECKLISKKPDNISLFLTNRKYIPDNVETVKVSTDYWREDGSGIWHLPEGMHPYIYYRSLIPNLTELRFKENRRIGIFFSGNLNENLYDLDIIKSKFNLLSRIQMIDIIKSEFTGEDLLIPQRQEDLSYDNLSNTIVINDHRMVQVPQEEYIKFLSDCNFFLYTPGVAMPLCRNNFESMAAGCIPILQYAHFHYPNLKHGENCIVFENSEDLIEKIKWALNLPEEEIALMRKNILIYYDTYIDEKAVIRNIENKINEGNLKELLIVQG